MQALVVARKLGLPLETCAETAAVSPLIAQEWLLEGRRLITHYERADRPELNPADYRALCMSLARRWDSAVAGTLAVLRGYMLEHAKKDPRACMSMLTSFERDYADHPGRRRRPAALGAGEPTGAERLGPADLEEEFAPLLLAPPGAPTPRQMKAVHTAADGSTTTVELTEGDRYEDRTDEELEYYDKHSHWPEEAEVASMGDESDIDAEGEEVFRDGPLDSQTEELEQVLAAAAGEHPPLERHDPLAALLELDHSEVQSEAAAPAPSAPSPAAPPTLPAYEPLRRIDPLAGR